MVLNATDEMTAWPAKRSQPDRRQTRDWHVYADYPAGLMFALRRKKLSGSYFFFSAANRS